MRPDLYGADAGAVAEGDAGDAGNPVLVIIERHAAPRTEEWARCGATLKRSGDNQ
jgi:hypothetical protein